MLKLISEPRDFMESNRISVQLARIMQRFELRAACGGSGMNAARYLKGMPGGPGRPVGSRNKLTEDFFQRPARGLA